MTSHGTPSGPFPTWPELLHYGETMREDMMRLIDRNIERTSGDLSAHDTEIHQLRDALDGRFMQHSGDHKRERETHEREHRREADDLAAARASDRDEAARQMTVTLSTRTIRVAIAAVVLSTIGTLASIVVNVITH